MNEFEKLEAELKELRPLRPSEEFTNRLEKALGDAGNVAMRCLPDGEPDANVSDRSASSHAVFSFPRLLTFTGLTGLGLAAVWAMIFYVSASFNFRWSVGNSLWGGTLAGSIDNTGSKPSFDGRSGQSSSWIIT